MAEATEKPTFAMMVESVRTVTAAGAAVQVQQFKLSPQGKALLSGKGSTPPATNPSASSPK